MPAVSEEQRRAAAVALAAKRGQRDPKTLTGAALHMYQNMSEEQLEHYAREVRKVVLEKVDNLSGTGLQLLHLRLHQLYSVRLVLREETEDIVEAHRNVVVEIERRNMLHNDHGLLDKVSEADDTLEEVFDETENQVRHRVRNPGDFRPDTFRTIQLGTKGVSAVVGKLKAEKVPEGHDPNSMVLQAVRFDKEEGWTKAKAREWIAQHRRGALRETELTLGDLPAEAVLQPRQEKIKNPQVEGLSKQGTLGPALEKRDEDRFTLSVAYPVDEVDAHEETAKPEAVEKAAWWFMLNRGQVGLMHDESPDFEEVGTVVESYVYRGPDPWRTSDGDVNRGDWLVGVIWKEPYWEAIKRGEYTGLSLHGTAKREPLE